MAGPGFTQVFGGAAIYPANSSYSSLSISVNTLLSWPIELAAPGLPVVSAIMDVTATVGGLSLSFDDAREVSTGYTALFTNAAANTFTVKDAGGNTLASPASGTSWLLYLTDNSTANGTWRSFQLGAGTSTANAAALAGFGLFAISTTLNSNLPVVNKSANYNIVAADRASTLRWTGGNGLFQGPGTLTDNLNGWFCVLKNSGTGNLTFTPGTLIDGVGSLILGPNQSVIIVCDGDSLNPAYYSIGLGNQNDPIFDFISINLVGVTGNYVLSAAQLNRISYRFTNFPAGNVSVIVPNTVQQYWIDNEIQGGPSLTIKTATGTGVTVPTGVRTILYCDGTNVVNALNIDQDSGSFTATFIGFTVSQTGLAIYSRVGQTVTLRLPAVGGTSNANTFSMTTSNVPASIKPLIGQYVSTSGVLQDNGTTAILSAAVINTDGSITFTMNGNTAGWTTTGAKATNPASLTYLLNNN